MIRKREALEYHQSERPGKIGIHATKACLTPREMRFAYLPGARFPAKEIAEDPLQGYRYTSKGNLVGVITNGSSVPGLGKVGPMAAKPLQEGIAVLFKRLADIDVFDLELDTDDPQRLVETIEALEPTFGGINLKDINVEEGLYVYDRLSQRLNIPVFNENLYGTAVVASAALLNALDLVEKKIEDIRVVICGAGNIGIGCARLFVRLGLSEDQLLLYDSGGLLHPDRKDMADYKRWYSREDSRKDMTSGIRGADVFVGACAAGILTREMVRSMNAFPILFALSAPEPEMDYESARACRKDAVIATGLSLSPNAVLDLLSFPYIFRGALDVQATQITEDMLLAASRALADLAREDVPEEVKRAYGDARFSFGPQYLLPKPIDPRILVRESAAVAQQAMKDGVARLPIEYQDHRERLSIRLGTGRETMRELIFKARQQELAIVFAEGTDETVLRACATLIDERIASPILLGDEERVRECIENLDIDLEGVRIIDPRHSRRFDGYVNEYFKMRCRRGLMRAEARKRLLRPEYFAALMLHSGDVDMAFTGITSHYAESLRTILQIIGPGPGIRRVSSHHMIMLPKNIYFLADCAVNIDPTAEELAEIALLAASRARSVGIEPSVAMLSFSNFGSVNHPYAHKVRQAAEIARERAPELMVEGEMQLAVAVKRELRHGYFPFSELKEDANVFIFPDLQSGNLALDLLQYIGGAVPVGPILMGTRLPVHLRQYGATAEEVVNLCTVGVVEAAALRNKNIT